MSRRIFMDALARKNRPGVFSVGTGTSIACVELMDVAGAHFPLAHTDAETMARLALAGHTILGLDVVMPLFSVCHEVAALGSHVHWGRVDSMPESGPPIWKTADDIHIPPDFLTHPSAQTPLKALSLLKKRLGNSAAVCGKVFGGWTLSYHLFGLENFLMGTLDDPDHTRRILDKLVPVTVQFARAQIDAGADCLLLADHATRDLCGPQAYRDFLLPLHARLAREIPVPLIVHICGNTSDRIALIAQTGVACFHWDTKSGAPAQVRAWADQPNPALALMGGVNNLTLLNGQPEEVTQMALAAAAAGIDIVGPECAIPLRTPLSNLKAIAAARKA